MASTISLPAVLSPALSPREAVADALYRCVNGLDTNDSALFDSAFIEDATFDVNGRVSQGIKAIHSDCFDVVAKLDTMHFITNVRVNIVGDKARFTASTLSQHFRGGKGMEPDQTRLLAGALYWADLVKDGELWKIDSITMKPSWAEGDWSVVMSN